MTSSSQPLTRTLILALTQTEELQRHIEESAEVIEQLRRENEKLRLELEELRQARNSEQPNRSFQLDDLFRKDAEKQAKIDHLKSKLQMVQAKERKWRLKTPHLSSPITSSDEADPHMNPGTTSRKRLRSKSPETEPSPLRRISPNLPAGGNLTPRSFGDRGADAIPSIAEDGEDHIRGQSDSIAQRSCEGNEAGSPRQRLQTLLAAPAPAPTPLLPRAKSNSLSPRMAPLQDQVKPETSLPLPNVNPLTIVNNNSVRKPLLLPPKLCLTAEPEDQEPLRSRPVNCLSLSHFKVDPERTGGYDHVYDKVVRGGEARKCLPGCMRPECCGGKLAATLPADPHLSDDVLLLDFLGTESEARIRSLTPLARMNLVHEARTKRLADLYGKMPPTAFERAQSPPGFWNTDMPGTQENKEDQEQVRLREQEEVERRYREAQRENGQWLFADE
ncbi:uncharacterized protein Z518_11182 [Rhinocladiella mackenziei CBS 650.93]|uniref:DNA endonuclease activator Ctp1 C-terminal domain-containing protein n=1 Tax=Rhinocladiella mackenziei CBS 650.93 TaxID=1442369 RepID=A0A0D2I162_9EURO|nr:uncharacterized protein Z518_11182 [Rhinocladiella mackenziei CBS 650.93]KIW99443.1 hypothetical protein Z518_11182 [Rhinocladiella mackenziei CBS 650.93]